MRLRMSTRAHVFVASCDLNIAAPTPVFNRYR